MLGMFAKSAAESGAAAGRTYAKWQEWAGKWTSLSSNVWLGGAALIAGIGLTKWLTHSLDRNETKLRQAEFAQQHSWLNAPEVPVSTYAHDAQPHNSSTRWQDKIREDRAQQVSSFRQV